MLDVELKKADASNIQMLTLSGEFDLADQGRVQGLLPEVLTDSCRGLVVDLTDVIHMEEAGVETLIYYLQELSRIGANMAVIVKPESKLMSKLNRLGIFACMGIKAYSSVNEAEAAIAAGTSK